jgi:hypothetical protein
LSQVDLAFFWRPAVNGRPDLAPLTTRRADVPPNLAFAARI